MSPNSDVQRALDTLDDLMSASTPLSDEELDAIDAWANNVQLDIMRHRRLHAREASAPGHLFGGGR